MGKTRVNRTVLIFESENFEAAVEQFSGSLGIQLGAPVVREDLGLRAVVGWETGLEIVAPVGNAGMAPPLRDYLRTHGEGFFCLVVEVEDLDAAESVMASRGFARLGERLDCLAINPSWKERFRSALEAVMEPIAGVGVTLIALDRR